MVLYRVIIDEGVTSHGFIENGTTFGFCTGVEDVTSVGVVQGIVQGIEEDGTSLSIDFVQGIKDVPSLGFVGGIEEDV